MCLGQSSVASGNATVNMIGVSGLFGRDDSESMGDVGGEGGGGNVDSKLVSLTVDELENVRSLLCSLLKLFKSKLLRFASMISDRGIS